MKDESDKLKDLLEFIYEEGKIEQKQVRIKILL